MGLRISITHIISNMLLYLLLCYYSICMQYKAKKRYKIKAFVMNKGVASNFTKFVIFFHNKTDIRQLQFQFLLPIVQPSISSTFYARILVQNFGAKNYKAETKLEEASRFAFIQKGARKTLIQLTPVLNKWNLLRSLTFKDKKKHY
jgi:hypothetical protein